jgi:hypothetical protein
MIRRRRSRAVIQMTPCVDRMAIVAEEKTSSHMIPTSASVETQCRWCSDRPDRISATSSRYLWPTSSDAVTASRPPRRSEPVRDRKSSMAIASVRSMRRSGACTGSAMATGGGCSVRPGNGHPYRRVTRSIQTSASGIASRHTVEPRSSSGMVRALIGASRAARPRRTAATTSRSSTSPSSSSVKASTPPIGSERISAHSVARVQGPPFRVADSRSMRRSQSRTLRMGAGSREDDRRVDGNWPRSLNSACGSEALRVRRRPCGSPRPKHRTRRSPTASPRTSRRDRFRRVR